ncbi:acyl-CoA dehydrogenase family protein [Sphingomonas sp. Mn802worker]|uniref:acyl-CoA dehydrogenase family protein n=1 Tax=Sphingomonas sp. Mn802worker TaxID=629773 RepID=UPI00036A697B|nr:acyl-CoA dehydrogenase family protein [Sphingomonas sp. Mn802worker]
MDLIPDDEQVLLRETVRRFLADGSDATTMGKGPMPHDAWRAVAELGLLSFLLPEAAGGTGGRPQDAAIIAEEMGRALAITPLAESIGGAADLIARAGDAGRTTRWVEPALMGEHHLALAQAPVNARGDTLAGDLGIVPWAAGAAATVVLADKRAWVVEPEATGVTVTPVRLIDGTPGATVLLANCAATPLNVTAAEVDACLATVRLCHTAELVGAMTTLYEQAVAYARERKQFGVAIGSFQVVQHKLARMFVAIEQSRSLLLKAAVADRSDAGFVRATLAAKAYAAEKAQAVAEDAVHLHGGMGVTDELAVGRGLRRVMLLARASGSAAQARQALAA